MSDKYAEEMFPTPVVECARCLGDHERVVCRPFTNPPKNHPATHFANCPETGEPLLVTIETGGEDE